MALVQPLERIRLPLPGLRTKRQDPRQPRSDKKHRATFRTHAEVWEKIRDISLLAGGSSCGASCNLVLNMLVQYALMDQYIVNRVMTELPQLDSLVSIRDWKAK